MASSIAAMIVFCVAVQLLATQVLYIGATSLAFYNDVTPEIPLSILMPIKTMHSAATSLIPEFVPTEAPRLEARDPEPQRGKVTTITRGAPKPGPPPPGGPPRPGAASPRPGAASPRQGVAPPRPGVGPPWAGGGPPWKGGGPPWVGPPWANGAQGPPPFVMACWNGEGPCPPFVSVWMSSCAASRSASQIAGACGPTWVGPTKSPTPKPTSRNTNTRPLPGDERSNSPGLTPVTSFAGTPSPRPLALLTVKTIPRSVTCRQYADTVTNDWTRAFNISGNSAVGIGCWTISSLVGTLGEVNRDNVWLLNGPGNCWINEQDIQRDADIIQGLPYCAPPLHWVGALQAQYSRRDCYTGLTLDAPSINLGTSEYVDLSCMMYGETNRGNNTWIRHAEEKCYFPGAVFDDSKWHGRNKFPMC